MASTPAVLFCRSFVFLVFQKQVVHCLVIVSRLSPSIADKRDIGVHYEKLFKSCQQRYQGEGPTGLLLVYPQHCVHLVESPWEIIVQVISDLNTMQKEQWVFINFYINFKLMLAANISLVVSLLNLDCWVSLLTFPTASTPSGQWGYSIYQLWLRERPTKQTNPYMSLWGRMKYCS